MHILFVGNPGVGKSCLLNSLIGQVHFDSGVSVGTGLTRVLKTVRGPDGNFYSDTPGLEDVEMREIAAEEISKALQSSGDYKVVFVCTLEAGRLSPNDLATVAAVLNAIERENIDIENPYSVLLNKVSQQVLHRCRSTAVCNTLVDAFSSVKPLSHLGFLPYFHELDTAPKKMLPDATLLKGFISDAPIIRIPSSAHVRVRPNELEHLQAQLEKELEEIHARIKALENARWWQMVYDRTYTVASGFVNGAAARHRFL